MRLLVVPIAAILTLVGCGVLSAPTRVSLGVANGTKLIVSMFVNGQRVGDFPPLAPGPTIDSASLPQLPWKVEATSASGRVLTSMTVEPGDVRTTTGPEGEIERTGSFGRVDLSCGRLTIWAGDVQPSGPAPPPSPGSPGDCVP